MSYANFDDVLAQLRLAGLVIDTGRLSFDGRIQRWLVEGEDREKRGWSRLREWTSKAGNTYIVGVYGVWHGNDDGRQKIELPQRDDPAVKLSDEDIAAMKAAQKEAQKKLDEARRAEAKQAARWAAAVWTACEPCAEHEYLQRKQIQPHGVRLMGKAEGLKLDGLDESNHYRLMQAEGALVVPMHDEHANVCGIQFIYPKGHDRAKKIERDKEFWPSGMAMGGTFGLIGRIKRDGIILVAEGYATAASLYEATGQTVAYAFSANNLAKAGKLLRKTCPAARLLFCADDDYLTAGNPGVTAASNATAEIERSAWIRPDFTGQDGNDLREGKKLTDYNDLYALTGLTLPLANQINARLDELKWRDAPLAGEVSPQGERGDWRRRACSVMALDDIVARFVPLDDGTGKYVFDTWTNKVAHKDQMITLLPAGARGDDIKRHPLWIERGAYYIDQVGFDPTGKDAMVKLNTWRGWPMTPKRGKCDALIDLIEYLCSKEDNQRELVKWLLCWMAYPLQNPGAKMHSAVILHGPQGTGKSTVFQTLAKIYGDYATVLNQRGLEDKFNSDWADSKLFILAEEVVTRQEMHHIKNELKALVTGEWIRINPKNIAAYRQRNQINIAYLSNEGQPLPLENDDRRHCVIRTPPAMSEEYYDAVFLELENGGVEAFYDYLTRLDLGDFHPKKRPPMTQAKEDLIALSLPSEQRFIKEWAAGDTPLPVGPVLCADFYTAYLRWCRENGERFPRASNQFGGAVIHIPGWERKRARVMNCVGKKPLWVYVPPIQILTENKATPPEDKTEAAWISDSVNRFKTAMKEGEQWE